MVKSAGVDAFEEVGVDLVFNLVFPLTLPDMKELLHNLFKLVTGLLVVIRFLLIDDRQPLLEGLNEGPLIGYLVHHLALGFYIPSRLLLFLFQLLLELDDLVSMPGQLLLRD